MMPKIDLIHDDEEFRRIYHKGVKTNYMISNYGRVWSDNRDKIMKNGTDRAGRANIHLLVEGKNWIPNISRLMGEAFLGEPPEDGWEIDHIDNNPFNDSLENLQWLSPFENKSKAHRDGSIKYFDQPVGEDAYNSKYTNKQVRYACELMEDGYDVNFIFEETELPKRVIYNIYYGKDWVSISSQYVIQNMSKSKPRKTPEHIKQEVLQLIHDGYTNKEIGEIIYDKYHFEANTLANNLRKRMKK